MIFHKNGQFVIEKSDNVIDIGGFLASNLPTKIGQLSIAPSQKVPHPPLRVCIFIYLKTFDMEPLEVFCPHSDIAIVIFVIAAFLSLFTQDLWTFFRSNDLKINHGLCIFFTQHGPVMLM
jgi:hypothetical protein